MIPVSNILVEKHQQKFFFYIVVLFVLQQIPHINIPLWHQITLLMYWGLELTQLAYCSWENMLTILIYLQTVCLHAKMAILFIIRGQLTLITYES